MLTLTNTKKHKTGNEVRYQYSFSDLSMKKAGGDTQGG